VKEIDTKVTGEGKLTSFVFIKYVGIYCK